MIPLARESRGLSKGQILYRVARPSIGPDVHIETKPEVMPGSQPMVDLAPLRYAFRHPDRIGAFADRMFVALVAVARAVVMMGWFVGVWFPTH